MEYATDVRTVSRYVIDCGCRDGKPISILTLHKFLYSLQTVYCRMNRGEKLLFPEQFYAFPYGPVISPVHREYIGWGGRGISKRYADVALDEETKSFIDDGISVLRERSPYDLSLCSTHEESPWRQVYEGINGEYKPIPNELIVADATK